METKFEATETSAELMGVYGGVHCSLGYLNDEPNSITFAQHRKGEDRIEYHTIHLYLKDIPKLLELLKVNEIIK